MSILNILKLRRDIQRWRNVRGQADTDFVKVECDKEIKMRLIKQGEEYAKAKRDKPSR